MSKIVQVVNKMIENANKIEGVLPSNSSPTEVFFIYDKKYKWSILKSKDSYTLFYFPEQRMSLNQLAALDAQQFEEEAKSVIYRTDDIKTREALESFSELYNILYNRLYGADDILDEIINA